MASAGFGAAFRHLRGLFGAGSVVALDDGQLLARYESGRDEAAFEALIGRHGPMVLTTCRAVLKDEHDVEDAFQATFLVLARKAGSIRGHDALAGWLHRVAYRASVQAGVEAARRRRKEAEASEIARMNAPRRDPDPELGAILHEEVDRLPEAHRLPVVLCDLEGLTYEQAAHHLHWTVPTLRNRLARGRQALKARLTRRGVMAPAIVALLASKAPAAVPPTLARMTLAAATGGSASAGATLLTHTILRGMMMTQLKIASTAALAALALASAGWVASGGPEDPKKPAMTPEPKAKIIAKLAPAAEVPKPTEMVEVRGQVVATDGKPVEGATVRAVANVAAVPEARSGPDGRFRLRIPPQDPSNLPLNPVYPWVVASAPGFAMGWVNKAFEPGLSGELTVRLVEDGPPIEGRIVDLEGRPVVGARVKAASAWFDDRDGLDAWIARAKEHGVMGPQQGLTGLPTPFEAMTGPDGRFKLTGIGRDRVASLVVSGPTIATSDVYVVLREGSEIRSVIPERVGSRTVVLHAPKFQFAAVPTKPVEGIVLDRETGRPIAGLSIQARAVEPVDRSLSDVNCRTDDQGRYRLSGLPKASAYRLSVYPFLIAGLPYPDASMTVRADSPGLDPVMFNFTLKRGVLIRGRVTNKATGRPVAGYVHAYTFRDNPNLEGFPASIEGGPIQVPLDPEGRYQFVVPPGRGILACRSDLGRYRGGVGAEAIEGFDPKYQMFKTVPTWLLIGNYHGLAEIRTGPKAESATVDLQLDPGRSVMVATLDPEGRPIGGTVAKGVGDLFQSTIYPLESPSFEVHALDPSKPRRVTVTHEARKLVGSVFLNGDEAGPITIKLQPWGTVAGRIIDEEGRPRKGLGLSSLGGSQPKEPESHGILPNGDWSNGILLGADGRFRVEGLIPGLKYGASVVNGSMQIGELFKDLDVAPGEVKDLGDLKVQPFKNQQD